jgi:predicted NBD/HSP70 family sugar kinase
MERDVPPAERHPRFDSSRPRPLADSILRLIWDARQISRADLARRTDLARSTISEIVTILLPTGLIAEVGPGPSRGGRRPIVLEFQDHAGTIIGVEMGAAHVAAALTDLRGRILAWEHRGFSVRTDPDGTRALILELCDALLAKSPHGEDRLLGVGIGVPSPVDPSRPDHLPEVVLPSWGGRGGLEVVYDRYGVPVMVDNDANLGALAEQWWGAGKNVSDFAYVKVSTGIGSGHVIGDEVYRGATGVAGEIGHLTVDFDGELCVCGNRGCLATVVGGQALEARARALFPEYPDSRLVSTTPTIVAIEDAALEGDPLALRIVSESAEFLGIALAGMLNVMNPSLIVIGGGLAKVGDLLLDPLREAVTSRTLLSTVAASAIRASELGPRSVALGAATIVLKSALEDSRLFARVSEGIG